MSEEAVMYSLYLVYYFLFPVGVLLLLITLWKKKDFIRGVSGFGRGREEESASTLKDNMADMRKLQVFLVLFILIFFPVVNLTFSNLTEITMSRDRYYAGGMGQSRIYNPIQRQLGPSSDVDSIISEMETYLFSLDRAEYDLEEGAVSEHMRLEFEEKGYEINEEAELIKEDEAFWIIWEEEKKFRIEQHEDELEVYEKPPSYRNWFIEDIQEFIDFEHLTRYPGELAVYRLRKTWEHIVITYTYYSPVPIMRIYGFNLIEDEVFLDTEETIVYPMDPGRADPF